jgi:hypothetical protein
MTVKQLKGIILEESAPTLLEMTEGMTEWPQEL